MAGIGSGKWGDSFKKQVATYKKALGKDKPPTDIAKALKQADSFTKTLSEADKFVIIFSMARGSNKEDFLEPYTKKARQAIAEHKDLFATFAKAHKNKANAAFAKSSANAFGVLEKEARLIIDNVERAIRLMAKDIGVEVKKAEKAAKGVVGAEAEFGKGRQEYLSWAKQKKLRSAVNIDSKKDEDLARVSQIEDWNDEFPKATKTMLASLDEIASWWSGQKEHKKNPIAKQNKAIASFASDHTIKRPSDKFNLPGKNDDTEDKESKAEVGKKRAALKKELKELQTKIAEFDVMVTNAAKSAGALTKAINADIKRRKELKKVKV